MSSEYCYFLCFYFVFASLCLVCNTHLVLNFMYFATRHTHFVVLSSNFLCYFLLNCYLWILYVVCAVSANEPRTVDSARK